MIQASQMNINIYNIAYAIKNLNVFFDKNKKNLNVI